MTSRGRATRPGSANMPVAVGESLGILFRWVAEGPHTATLGKVNQKVYRLSCQMEFFELGT